MFPKTEVGHAAAEIRRQAATDGTPAQVLIEELGAIADAEDAAEEAEIARIVRERTASGESTPLADLDRPFGINLDEL